MGAVATPERRALVGDPPATEHPAARRFKPRTGGVSLEDSILRTWEDLIGQGSAGCPVCGGRMHPTAGCDHCGTELS